MNREQFFQELRTALHREGFTPQPEQDELLPVEWDGLPLCRITADGGVRYWQEDVATPERERACERATDLACTVREYMTLLEQAVAEGVMRPVSLPVLRQMITASIESFLADRSLAESGVHYVAVLEEMISILLEGVLPR